MTNKNVFGSVVGDSAHTLCKNRSFTNSEEANRIQRIADQIPRDRAEGGETKPLRNFRFLKIYKKYCANNEIA